MPEPEEEEDEDEIARPSFKVDIPAPSFKLNQNADQHNSRKSESPVDFPPQPLPAQQPSKPRSKSSKSSYNMFVQGASEFTHIDAKVVSRSSQVEEWPEGNLFIQMQLLCNACFDGLLKVTCLF